ncbi:MAG TPA: DUF5668 domain-containing protein [Desulfosporosinus sp.]|nr:DUF5668 domain-containing protein [Desulfosporosinus sp.]
MRTVFNSVSRGLLLIAIGVVIFLINYGYLSWNLWLYAVDLWPLILILAGIGLLFGRRIPISAVLLVFLLSMVGYSMAMGDKPVSRQMLNPFYYISSSGGTGTLDVPLPSDVKKARINLKLEGTQVQVQALDSGNGESQLISGNYRWKSQGSIPGPQGAGFSTEQAGDTLTATLSPALLGGNDKLNLSDLELNLSTKANYDLDITAGAIKGTIDVSRLLVDNLKISTGASNFELQFGDTGVVTKGEIDSGASELTLIVPENVGLNIRLNGVASSTNFMGSGLLLENKNWVTPNYAEAKTKIDLELSMAAGSVQLERSKANIQ